MAFEIRDALQLNDGTLRKPFWEVYDTLGRTNFEWSISRVIFQLIHVNTGTVIASGDSNVPGECAINNADEDAAGNEIKTVRPTIDLTSTDTQKGAYKLWFHIFFDTGEDDFVRQPVQIVDYGGL